jgi:hypothetical protein
VAPVRAPDGGGGQLGPFERYPVTAEGVCGAGDSVSGYAGNLESLQADVDGAHHPAQWGVAGLLASPMLSAARPVQERAGRWLRSAVFGGAAIRLFGDGVAGYNRGVDDLNSRYWAAKGRDFGLSPPDLPEDATGAERREAADEFRVRVAEADRAMLGQLSRERHTVLEPALDEQASWVARLLDAGPDSSEAVVELYAAGSMPWTAPMLFRGVDFSQVPLQLSDGDGAQAAETIRRALAGDASPEEFHQAMLLLQVVTDRAGYVQEHGGSLTDPELAFLHDFYNGLGDKLWELPDYIDRDEHHWDAPAINPFGWFDKDAPGFDQDTRGWMLAATGTGLLALSNTQLWPPDLRSRDPMDAGSPYHLPETVIRLVRDPAVSAETTIIGGYPYLEIDVDRMDDFTGLARMLGAAPDDLEGGTRFSELLTQRVAEVASAAQRVHEYDLNDPGLIVLADAFNDFQGVSGTLEALVEVSTRNDEANFRLLTGAANDPMVRIGSHLQDPVYELDNRQFLLQSLYHFDWSDDGAAAAGLTDWISDRAGAAAAGGGYDQMATEAAAALVDLVTTTERGEGHDDPEAYRVDMYDDLMRTLADRNPEVARSFSRIAAAYLDDFSEPSGPETLVEGDGSLSLSDHDKVRFLDLVATDDQAINGLSYAAGQYEQRLLGAGLEGEAPMTEVGQRSSRLDGLLAAARVNADLAGRSQEFADAQAAYEEHMRYAGYGKTAFTTIAGVGVDASPLKPASPFINAGLGVLADEVISGAVPAPGVDPGFDPGDILDQGRDETYAAYDYLTALNANGLIPANQIPDEYFQTAPPYSGASFETTVYHDGRPVLKPIGELHGGERQALVTWMYNEDGGGVGGDEFKAYLDNYDASDSFDGAAAQSLERAQAHRQGLR